MALMSLPWRIMIRGYTEFVVTQEELTRQQVQCIVYIEKKLLVFTMRIRQLNTYMLFAGCELCIVKNS